MGIFLQGYGFSTISWQVYINWGCSGMDTNGSDRKLGVIICRNCDSIIDTVDTEKVITYYVNCGGEQCQDNKVNQGGMNNDN
ncbi:MAG: GapA-binding peptide SR1P [Candidatus Pristimantibacillus sp.]